MLKVCHTFVFSLILLCASVATAQTNVDPTFNAVPSRPFSATGAVPDQEQASKADGEVLFWGGALAVGVDYKLFRFIDFTVEPGKGDPLKQ